jgi:DNA-binding MarR family transcriptional regulator
MSSDPELLKEAETITALLRVIRQVLKRPVDVAIAGSGLTAPQVSVLQTLARTDGLSLKDLSARLGLSHSTVSGIVDRLARRDLVRRRPGTEDRRFTRIHLTDRVKHFVTSGAALHHPEPLLRALRRASAEERLQIRRGLEVLRSLLETPAGPEGAPAPAKKRRAGANNPR